MTVVKLFKIVQKFNGTEDLYKYLLKSTDFVGQSTGIQIQKSLKDLSFCLIGKEKITEKNILFYASKGSLTENLGEIILLASQFEIYTVIIFSTKFEISHLDSINWLQEISSDNYEFIICQANF